MSAALLPLLTFFAVVATVVGVYSLIADLYLSDRTRLQHRIDDEFRKRQRERVRRSLLFKGLGQLSAEVAGEREKSATTRERLERMIEQSGLDISLRKLLVTAGSTGACVGLLVYLIQGNPLFGLLAAAVSAGVPLLYVELKRKKRLERMLSQLPDAFDLMGRVIRAGQTMSQAVQAVSEEFAQPIAGEFSYCYEQQNLGLSPETAFRELARRTGLLEIKIFVTALLVQQQTGGNLGELLDKLSDLIRQRYRIRGVIRTLTAEGRFQAVILLAVPFAMFFMLMFLNYEYESRLLEHPNLIGGTLIMEAVGAVWIRKIVNFDF